MSNKDRAFDGIDLILVTIIAVLIVALGGSAGALSGQTFEDVPPSHTHYESIEWLADQGITQGCNPPDNTLFCPEREMTRAEMATFLYRALEEEPTTTTTTEAQSTTTTTQPTTTTTAAPEGFACTRVLGMSLARQTYEGLVGAGAADGEWEAQIEGGSLLRRDWNRRNFEGYTNTVISPCGETDRVLFVYDPLGADASDWDAAISHIRHHNPSVEQVELILVYGLEGHNTCPSDGERSTTTHRDYYDEHVAAAGRHAGVAAPDFHVRDCGDFLDRIGHLTNSGKSHIGQVVLDHYEGS